MAKKRPRTKLASTSFNKSKLMADAKIFRRRTKSKWRVRKIGTEIGKSVYGLFETKQRRR